MNRTKARIAALSLTSICAVLLASCSTPESADPSLEQSGAAQETAEGSPTPDSTADSATASADSSSASPSGATLAELDSEQEVHGIRFMTPAKWSVKCDDCEGQCTKWDEWQIRDEAGKHVLTLIPTTATSPDGDPNLYQREILDREELADPGVPGFDFNPASLIAEFHESTSQEDGEKDTGFNIALVDDNVLDTRNEQPDLDYFIVGDQAPMMWVEDDYMEAFGVGDDPTREQAQQFLESQQYTLVRGILLSVGPAAG